MSVRALVVPAQEAAQGAYQPVFDQMNKIADGFGDLAEGKKPEPLQ